MVPNKLAYSKTPAIKTSYLKKIYFTDEYIRTMSVMTNKVSLLLSQYKFDAIAFTGTSGAAVAYPLSLTLGLPLICVRKEKSHYSDTIEGVTSSKKYIIVDDFISSGETIKRIIREISNTNSKSKPVGIILYNGTTSVNSFNKIPVWCV